MTVRAWRIVKRRHAAGAFSGEGARQFGGRWNGKGRPMVYTAGGAALAALEMLAHLDAYAILDEFVLIEARFDAELVEDIDARRLPGDWRSDPAPLSLRRIGDEWTDSLRSAVLKVPSAIVEVEHNFLLNPAHPDFAKISIGAPARFAFDPRLAK